jgi:hypothetical protein
MKNGEFTCNRKCEQDWRIERRIECIMNRVGHGTWFGVDFALLRLCELITTTIDPLLDLLSLDSGSEGIWYLSSTFGHDSSAYSRQRARTVLRTHQQWTVSLQISSSPLLGRRFFTWVRITKSNGSTEFVWTFGSAWNDKLFTRREHRDWRRSTISSTFELVLGKKEKKRSANPLTRISGVHRSVDTSLINDRVTCFSYFCSCGTASHWLFAKQNKKERWVLQHTHGSDDPLHSHLSGRSAVAAYKTNCSIEVHD